MMNGADSIDSTIAASTSCGNVGVEDVELGRTAPAARTRTRRPARDRSRCAAPSPSGAPNSRARTTISTSLTSTGPISSSEHPAAGASPTMRRSSIHADGDEEQAEQHVAKRLDVLLDLVAVFGLGDQHAGEKRAERERQSGELGQRREPERDQQQVQHEQLARALPRNQMEPRAHRPLSERTG